MIFESAGIESIGNAAAAAMESLEAANVSGRRSAEEESIEEGRWRRRRMNIDDQGVAFFDFLGVGAP